MEGMDKVIKKEETIEVFSLSSFFFFLFYTSATTFFFPIDKIKGRAVNNIITP